MAKQPVNPERLVTPRGFSHAFEAQGGRLLFLAGQVAADKEGRAVGRGDLVAQFRQIIDNLKAVLEDRAGSLQDIVKLTIYVLDRRLYRANEKAIGQVYREYFGRHYPAMTLVEVKGLYDDHDGFMIEIDGFAVLD
jgi:enamine deaminase RidA (YjgF/YER057c/UK114 family)